MRNSSKLFFITVVLILVSGILFYKGVEQEFSGDGENYASISPSSTPISSAFDEVILGEETVSTSSGQLVENVAQTSYPVTKVIDGDTIEVLIDNQKMRVRLIGVDTPETVDPNRPKGCFGKEASNELKRLLEGKEVFLEKDISDTDKYQRLLRYVYVAINEKERLFVNDYLIREGFGTSLTYPPDIKSSPQFLEAQRKAKELGKGLWGMCGG